MAALCVALLCPAGASAQPARQLLEQGIQRFSEGDLAASVQLLERAQTSTTETALLAKIHLYLGLNHAADRHPGKAREAFARALQHDGELRLDPYRYKPELVTLFESVRRERLAELKVMTDLEAEVWLDGARAGKIPFQRSLMAGRRLLELRGPGGKVLYRRQLELPVGRTTLVEVLLRREQREVATQATTRPAPAPSPRRIWTWAALAGAIAASAVAVGLGTSASNDHRDACALLVESTSDCEHRSQLKRGEDAAEYRRLYDSVGSKSLGANISWGIAGALAATALVLFFVEGRPRSEGTRLSFAPRLGKTTGFALSIAR